MFICQNEYQPNKILHWDDILIMPIDSYSIIGRLFFYAIIIIFSPLWIPFYIYFLVKSHLKYKKDIKNNGYAFLFKRNDTIMYCELFNNKIRKSIIGEYFHGKERYINLINKYHWDDEVVDWLKNRREELMQKLLAEVDTSTYEGIE